ncbi:MAG: selenoneine biosynthesis selenosugar synthase SenB [Gammaproteobacteria bacterium]|nr:selenoneine biosynthesis selenosugar synthase SenB [Gammaproteobacteria bacterium]
MKICLVTPAERHSRSGNRATAERWRKRLTELGHRVQVRGDYAGEDCDLLLAIHAWRSADAIRAFSERYPDRPLVVLLSGTDIYHFQRTEAATFHDSLSRAHALIGLHERVADDIPDEYRHKLGIVLQSATAPPRRLPPLESRFEACVIGHLREEKDSLRAAYAVRDLPTDSRLAVTQLGRARNADWAEAAEAEMARNPRYRWWGERPPATVRRIMARSRLMVMSSRMEGGANAVSEACVAGLPVIASAIPGNIGLLGEDYPGYYPVEDTRALRNCLLRAENDPDWLAGLARHCRQRARLFTPDRERASLDAVIQGVLTP